MNHPRLIVNQYGLASREIVLRGKPLSIGRDSHADIVIKSDQVSRLHARIAVHGQQYAIEDLGSLNGTYVGGQKIESHQLTPLYNGAVIHLGGMRKNSVSLTFLDSTGVGEPTGVIHLDQTRLGKSARYTIGRSQDNSLVLNSLGVSRHHAKLVRTANGYEISDLGSSNGTFVNGRRIVRAHLKKGDKIQISAYTLVYTWTGGQHLSFVGSVRLDALHLVKAVPGRPSAQFLLNDISLTILPGEFVALVGASGAGKSTLLDTLNGVRRPTSGKVLVNGNDYYKNFDAYRTNMGYVPQMDILHTGLTVKRALTYLARLRLPPQTTSEQVERRIDNVLKGLGLHGAQKNLRISKLSGGERKRVNIAAELLSKPSVLYLDEPTSGLDPGLDKKMMSTLKYIAGSGRTVLVVTHVTNNIVGFCKQLAFIAHGRLVYFGPPAQALQLFKAHDLASIYSAVETPSQAKDAELLFKHSSTYQGSTSFKCGQFAHC